jgi:hypothetical protein
MVTTTPLDDAIENSSDASRSRPQEIRVEIPETALFEGQIRAHIDAFVLSIDEDSRRHSPEPNVPRSARDSAHMV